jgi:hypothetical protein
MKNSLIVSIFAVCCAAPMGSASAASNKERVGLGNSKYQEQPPEAAATQQFCVRNSQKVVTVGSGLEQNTVRQGEASVTCSSTPATRSVEESRAEARKIERDPGN